MMLKPEGILFQNIFTAYRKGNNSKYYGLCSRIPNAMKFVWFVKNNGFGWTFKNLSVCHNSCKSAFYIHNFPKIVSFANG